MGAENIYVICDQCHKPTASGIAIDLATLADISNAFSNNRTKCQDCGNMILWGKATLCPESVVHEKFPK